MLKKPVRVGAILSNDQFQLCKSSNRDPVAEEDPKVRMLSKMFQQWGGKTNLPVVNWSSFLLSSKSME